MKKKRGILWAGQRSVDAGLKQLKIKVAGKTVTESEFQSLEVIGIKELAKALVRVLSKLTAKG